MTVASFCEEGRMRYSWEEAPVRKSAPVTRSAPTRAPMMKSAAVLSCCCSMLREKETVFINVFTLECSIRG